MKKIYYYDDFDSDVVKSKNQEYVLKTNYKWINKNIFYVIWSYVIYWIFLLISFFYIKLSFKEIFLIGGILWHVLII